VSALFDDYRSQNRNSYDIRTAQPGDLVAFEWGSTAGGYDHVAMIIGLTETGAWTRNGNVNGSKVADLWFPFDGGGMAEIARPAYTTSPNPQPDPSEDEMRDALIHDPSTGAVYRITQPGNLAVHLSPLAYEDAVAAGIIDLGDVSPGTLGNFGIVPSIPEVKG
jgi:hypothetical protein